MVTHPRRGALAALEAHTHPAGKIVVTEAEAGAIRAVFEQGRAEAARRLDEAHTLIEKIEQPRRERADRDLNLR